MEKDIPFVNYFVLSFPSPSPSPFYKSIFNIRGAFHRELATREKYYYEKIDRSSA